MRKIKKFIAGVLAGIMLICGAGAAYAAEPLRVYHIFHETTVLGRGVYLIETRRVTNEGFLDIAIMSAPLNDPNIRIDVFNSAEEFGLREPVPDLLAAGGAFAGVNGDFFGIGGAHSIPLGFEARGGHFSARGGTNTPRNTYASFIMGAGGNFIEYVRPEVAFLINGVERFSVGLVNKVTDLAWSSFLTREYMATTADLDARIPDSYKITVRWGQISHISARGETVDIPADGFVVIMNPTHFERYRRHFSWGDSAEMYISANINLGAVHTAISGGRRIVYNGQIADGLAAGARAPRTLLGLDASGQRLFLATIDGRSHSIGATLLEAARIMLEFGAHMAITLDGGGSTTMAARLPMDDEISVINTPADGAARGVVNALGIINRAPMGAITDIAIDAPDAMMVGTSRPIRIFGFDANRNRRELRPDEFALVIGGGGLSGNHIIAAQPGIIDITANYRGMTAQTRIDSVEVSEIASNINHIRGSIAPRFYGVSNMGVRIPMNYYQLHFTVYPENLGYFRYGEFFQTGSGVGFVRAATRYAALFLPITLNHEIPLNPLSGDISVNFSAFPHDIIGRAAYIYRHDAMGGRALRLGYDFAPLDRTQAAYINFADGLLTYDLGFRVALYGNDSGHWLRGNIRDADGQTFVIDFIRNIDFYGWRDVSAMIPAAAARPVTLERIYPVALGGDRAGDFVLFLDNLRSLRAPEGEIDLPQSSQATDPRFRTPAEFATAAYNERDFEFAAPLIFTQHETYYLENLFVINIMASQGGITATDPAQWVRINQHLHRIISQNVLIMLDAPPSSFRHQIEAQMLHDMAAQMATDGRNVFILSPGQTTTKTLRDNVRYITLSRQSPDTLIIRTSPHHIKYTITTN